MNDRRNGAARSRAGATPGPFRRTSLTGYAGALALAWTSGAQIVDEPPRRLLESPAEDRPRVPDPGEGEPAPRNLDALDRVSYRINEIELAYVRPNPGLPTVESLMDTPVTLSRVPMGFVSARPGREEVTLTLREISELPPARFSGSALQAILEAIRDELVMRDLMGVFVAPDPSMIGPGGENLRGASEDLRILITAGVVAEMRTVAAGERVPAEERIQNPMHERILRGSPFVAAGEDAAPEAVLREEALNRYIYHLSRHPGRRVDVALGPSEMLGGFTLDYLVTENKPLTVYAQVSNTGTEQTDEWRQRFGLFHTQLTNRDDVLSLDYITTNFDETHAVLGSYEFPWPGNDRTRVRVYGEWSEYTASEVGILDATFEGQSWAIGGEVIHNFYQRRELFFDAVAGLRYEEQEVSNRPIVIEGEEEFLIPYLGVRMDRLGDWSDTFGQVLLEWNLGGVTGADEGDLTRLGRFDPDQDWALLRADLTHSFFLEPVLNREAWLDPTTPESSTLAHEVALSLRGQYAFDNRLIPQQEMVIGGFYTVRGYPEAIVAGDTAILGTAEYRYHVPRAFGIEPEPREFLGRPFRYAPQYVYGVPDWDLVLKGFVDIGHVVQSDRLSFENNETLVGAGIGLDLLYRRNLQVRLDWGFALSEVEEADVEAGDSEVHFAATILF